MNAKKIKVPDSSIDRPKPVVINPINRPASKQLASDQVMSFLDHHFENFSLILRILFLNQILRK